MAQERVIDVSGINVVTHPHSPQGYVDLFRALFRLRRPVAVRGTQHLMIGDLRLADEDDPLQALMGEFYRFDQIDPDLPWFNLARHEEASDDEMAAIAIPDDLVPNLVRFQFVFFPRSHELYFVTKWGAHGLSARGLSRFLSRLCGAEQIVRRFGVVDLTVMPDHQQLERIFQTHRLAKLMIDVKKPNPDDNGADEERVFGRLERQGARRITQVLTAEPAGTIAPDDDTKVLAKVAAANGKVTAVGYTAAGERVNLSTSEAPWRAAVPYDPDFQTSEDALMDFAFNYAAD